MSRREGSCPNDSSCQSGILPLPSAVLGAEGLERLREQDRHTFRTQRPPPLARPHPRAPRSPGRGLPAPAGPGRGGPGAPTFVTVMQKLRGGTGPRARRAGATAGVRPGAPGGVRKGSGAAPRAPRAPREAQPSLGAALRAGSAQGPLVSARPPLVADVSPECAFIIDEPPSPQEGEAGRKGARERARAGGRGEEEGPGTRYKGGGGRRRKRTPARQPPCPAPPGSVAAAGHSGSPSPGPAPRPRGLNPFRPAAAWRPGELGPGTCQLGRGMGGDPGSACPVGPGPLAKSHARWPRRRAGRNDRQARPLEVRGVGRRAGRAERRAERGVAAARRDSA